MKVLPGLAVFLALEICMISIVFSRGILPQQEMQELDIFMEEEGHNQISRSKRTDSQADMEGESSGEVPESSSSAGQELVMPREDADAQNETVETTSPESQDNKDELLQPPGDSGTNDPPNSETDAPNLLDFDVWTTNSPTTDVSLKIDVVVIDRNTAKYISSTQSHENIQDTTSIPVTTSSPGPPIVDDSQQNSTSSGHIGTTGQPIPDYAPDVNTGNSEPSLGSRSGEQPVPDGTEIPRISSGTDARGVSVNMTVTVNVDEGPKQENAPIDTKVVDVPEITTAAPNLGASGKFNVSGSNEVPRVIDVPETPQVNTNQNVAVNGPDDKVSNNSTTSAPVKNVTKSETTTSVPNAGASGKSNVSGSGVLFTIVILVVVAGLAGLGYYMYKKRKSGYDPVAVEDRDREMGTMKAENGIGKPLTEDEIKSADQLTPIHPQATQRTFGGAPLDEKNVENVEVIKEDGENEEERDRREPSVEYKETDAKKEKDEGEGEDERKK